ncbi:MAG: mmuM, partial [Blastococcus sp.]|nr:mmuM [Blastococcus sp.]
MGSQYRERIEGMPSISDALAAGPVILDGGLSTELESRGHDVSSVLWSARLLRDDPGAIVAAHAAFAAAGAQVATTASYQATVEGFGAAGVDAAEAGRLIA